ncbi:uncharacterized protein dsx-c73A isoform X2 [Panulirus ornatus]|uniref:uncharacterized protein dsx-c73A isoform X2 n=1 Tax=Panulirus ornatus TaxID=150431 RepID=UPI003A853EAC
MARKMFRMIVCSVLAVATLPAAARGIEVIENYYKGEKYEPESHSIEELFPYSSSLIAAASSHDGQSLAPGALKGRKMPEGESHDLPFASLIRQLGLALHRTLTKNQLRATPTRDEPRDLDNTESTDEKETREDLYYYYPHKAHLFNLPECATQQVCNAVYKRLNFTQPLCQCPAGNDPCSVSTLTNDQRTIELSMGRPDTRATTLIKTCEPVWTVRDCHKPRDWSILALQNIRTGKAHYLVICKCPETSKLEGPLNHSQPSYANVPGIRVYGMMCVTTNYRRVSRHVADFRE